MPAMPWRLKIAAKVVLSRLPVNYHSWAKLGAFRHGKMNQLAYPGKLFDMHAGAARRHGARIEGGTVLEMGTGDSVAAALIARKNGVERTYLIDVGDFATRDMDFYRAYAVHIGLELPVGATYEQMLASVNGVQLTDGLAAWLRIPDGSLDFVWSHSTIEHVRKGEFGATFAAMFNAMRPGGIASHSIHLKDHLGGALNNLRFSEKVWEAEWFASRSGFYTNRLRPSELIALFEDAGFEVIFREMGVWKSLPTSRSALDPHFRDMSDEDLLATGMHVLLRKPD